MSLDSLSAMSARIQGVDGKILKAQQIQSKLHFKSSSIQSQITSRDRLINELSVKNTQSLADLKESESKAIEYIQVSIIN